MGADPSTLFRNLLCSAPCFTTAACRTARPALISRATPGLTSVLCRRCTTRFASPTRGGRACLALRTCGIPGPALIPGCRSAVTTCTGSWAPSHFAASSLGKGHATPKIEKSRGLVCFSRPFILFFRIPHLFLQRGDRRLSPTHLDPDKNGD